MKIQGAPLSAVALGAVALGLFAARVGAVPPAPQGVISVSEYRNIGGTDIPSLTNNVNFPNNPDYEYWTPLFEWPANPDGSPPPGNVANNYGTMIRGYIYPPTTGDYTFYISADDNARLFLSTDDSPANKQLIAIEPTWNGSRNWKTTARRSVVDTNTMRLDNASVPITLTKGKAYYVEALAKEGGGGDNLAVTWKLPGGADVVDGDPPIGGEFLAAFVNSSGPVTITQQPANATVAEGFAFSLKITLDGTPPYNYQWRKGGTDIPDATNGVYSVAVAALTDAGQYTCVVSGAEGASKTSSAATVTVTADSAGPLIESAIPQGLNNQLGVTFSEAVEAGTAGTAGNYTISGGVTVSSALPDPANTRRVLLLTSKMPESQTLTLTIRNVKDTSAAGNPVAANTTKDFKTMVFTPGWMTRDLFKLSQNAQGFEILDGTTFGQIQSVQVQPTSISYRPAFEAPADVDDNYFQRIYGFFTPSETANYVFYIASDDQSALYLSSDDSPANAIQIAFEPSWNGARAWTTTARRNADFPENKSNPVPLTANKRYYIEAVHTEGGGGDNLAVTVIKENDPAPADGSAALSGSRIGTYVAPEANGKIVIGVAPASTNAISESIVTFAPVIYVTNGTAVVTYQWQKNQVDIPGATGASYTTSYLTVADSGSKYRVVVKSATETVNSPEATLTVTADTVPPKPVAVASVDATFTKVVLSFTDPLDRTSAETGANYSFAPGNIKGASATLDSTLKVVTITTASKLTPGANVLTLNGVKDLTGNPVVPGTTIAFEFRPVTYEQNIQADGPVAYFRLEEASGTVAKNSGSSGVAGVYTNDFGDVGPAKGEAGPRPPAFAGFDSANRAGTFDGQADWIDAGAPYLNNLPAFTLEYWVKPADRANQPTRVGIVGQNDAVEYGFIDNATIQIWTPNGGSLNSAYTFADNEWHHVATIANGNNILTYYDGALVATGGTATSNYGSSSFNVHIGGGGVFDATGNYFFGQIDEVAIFNKAVSAERVAAHFTAGRDGGVLTTSGAVNVPGSNLKLSVATSGANVVLTWDDATATLQAADKVTGPYTDVAGATSPRTVSNPSGQKYWRLKK